MRLFIANMHLGWGGQSAVVVLLAEEMAKRGHDVMVAGRPGSELIKRSAERGLKTFDQLELARGLRPFPFMRDQRRIKACWDTFQPDAILTNGSQDTWACAIARRRFRPQAALVRWRHNSFPVNNNFLNRWLYKSLLDHVTVSSAELNPILTEPGLVTEDKITVFAPSTRLERFVDAQPTSNLRAELNIPKESPLVLAVGRLAPEKGHQWLLKAWSKPDMSHFASPAHLVIVGTGREEHNLRKLVEQLSIQHLVHMIGFRDDVPSLYAEADLAALAPDAGESFGIALLEAYATGLACVATDVGGVRDLVVPNETGWLVPKKDPEALVKALTEALTNSVKRNEYGTKGKKRVLEKFTPATLAETAETLFNKLLHHDSK